MASETNTELNATIPELWDEEIEQARYAGSVIMNRVTNKTDKVAKQGDSMHISIKARYTGGPLGSNSSFVPQTMTPTSINLVINTNVQVSVEVEEQARAQSFYDPLSDFTKDAGMVMGNNYDSSLAALHSNLNLTAVGTDAAPVIFNVDAMLTALKRVAQANIPMDDGMLSFILSTDGFYDGLLREQQLTAAQSAGVPKNVLTTSYQFSLRGVPFYLSNLLADNGAVTGKKGMLIHKSALAIGMQRNNLVKTADRTASLVLSTVKIVFSLYGVVTVRPDHGVVINIRSATT